MTYGTLTSICEISSLTQKNAQVEYFLPSCCNPSLGLATKAKACKVVGQEGSKKEARVTSRALGSVKECEGMNPHTPKWIPIMGIGVPNGRLNLQKEIAGVKTHQFEGLFISLNNYWNVDV
jgi:hypothetical protein